MFYAGWNAQMVSAALRAAELLDDTALGEYALKSLERVVVACYSPGAGIAHCLDGRPTVRLEGVRRVVQRHAEEDPDEEIHRPARFTTSLNLG